MAGVTYGPFSWAEWAAHYGALAVIGDGYALRMLDRVHEQVIQLDEATRNTVRIDYFD